MCVIYPKLWSVMNFLIYLVSSMALLKSALLVIETDRKLLLSTLKAKNKQELLWIPLVALGFQTVREESMFATPITQKCQINQTVGRTTIESAEVTEMTVENTADKGRMTDTTEVVTNMSQGTINQFKVMPTLRSSLIFLNNPILFHLIQWLLISSQISLQRYRVYLQTFSLSPSPLQLLNLLCPA